MGHRSRLTYSLSSIAVLGVVIMFLLSGCGGVAKGATLQPTASPTAVAYALLRPQPDGSATLTWDSTNNNTLTVDLAVAGLAPADPASYQSAPYPATLSSGNCQNQGNVVHQLQAITADQNGAGTNTTTNIAGVAGGIPAKGWAVVIHAPQGANQGAAAIACANVLNPNASTTAKQSVKAMFHDMANMHQGAGAYGKAKLELSGTTLTVTVALIGLAPGSKHEAHIHSGSCAMQGPVVHPLNVITADSSGRAQVETTIEGVQTVPGNWYINIHSGTDLKTQAGFQPIACGDLFTRS